MAISARSIKSIQYPHMPEEGMLEHWELKIHQASHARYFEDFLKYVSYEKPLPEVMGEQVVEMVHQYIADKWQEDESSERREEENAVEVWAASEKRDLQEWWTPEQVEVAAAALVEQKPDLPFTFKLGDVTVKGLLADFGDSIHFAKHNGRYVVVIEGDSFQFDKGMSRLSSYSRLIWLMLCLVSEARSLLRMRIPDIATPLLEKAQAITMMFHGKSSSTYEISL